MSIEKNSYNHQPNIRETNLSKEELDGINADIKRAEKINLAVIGGVVFITLFIACTKSVESQADIQNAIQIFKEVFK